MYIRYGAWLIIPISNASIADFFEGNRRLKMMGYSSGVRSIGGIIAPLLAGFLATYNWRYAFGIYSIAFLLLILVILFFEEKKSNVVNEKSEKRNIPFGVYKLAFGMFMLYVISFALSTNLSIFLFTYNIGDSKLSSILIFLLSLSIFLSGLTLSLISNVLKKYKSTVSYALMGIGFAILSYSINTIYMGIAALLIGISVGILTPSYMLNTTQIVTPKQRSYAIAIVSSCMFLGQFVSPLLSFSIQNVFNYEHVKLPFFISTILCLIIVLFNLSTINTRHRNVNDLN